MRTRLLSEGRSVPRGEQWFTRTYAVPIIRRESIVRWVASKNEVRNYSGEEPYRLVRVRTVMEMEFNKLTVERRVAKCTLNWTFRKNKSDMPYIKVRRDDRS